MEITIEQALQQGVAAHKEDKLQEAERLYRAILKSQPLHPDANHNLGVLAVSVNKAAAALPLFKTALEANPKIEQFWLSYIDALIREKQFDNAKLVIQQAKKQGLPGEKLNALQAQLAPITQINESKFAVQKKSQTFPENRKKLAENKKKTKSKKYSQGISPPEAEINNLLQHYQHARFGDAEKLAISITKEFSEHPLGWKVLGAILKQTGRISEALNASRKAVVLSPQDAEAHNILGNTLKELGRLDEAEASYSQAITLKSDYAEVHNNLGVTLKELGRLEEAEASLRHAITLKPDFSGAHYNLGNTLKDMGRLVHAEASYRQAIALKPDYAETHNNLGNTQKELGRLDEAEASYRQAIALKPDYSDAYLNLCELLEKSNKIDEALLVAKNAKEKVSNKEADFLFYEALVPFRDEAYEIAGRLIKKIKEDELTEKRKPDFLKLKGDLHHYKKDYSVAFETFKSMNEKVKDSYEYKKQAAEKYFKQQKATVFEIEQLQEKSSYRTAIRATWLQPTFLISFPRSGTTLLDSILRSHSKIDVVEEKPMLSKMESKLGHLPKISAIEEIDNPEAETLSGFYFEELEKYSQMGEGTVVIDKLPLNILKVPLINQIFPQAIFILALRHPLDCVFSCWMQNFRMNPAMANMVDLDRVVDFYCTAMEVFHLCQKRYELNIHRVRYEDLVLNFEGEVSNILRVLNLKWEEEIRNYRETAFARGMINTPSYSQVVKPIYNTASYRWKNYEKYLKPYKTRLAPWLQEYGYLS